MITLGNPIDLSLSDFSVFANIISIESVNMHSQLLMQQHLPEIRKTQATQRYYSTLTAIIPIIYLYNQT